MTSTGIRRRRWRPWKGRGRVVTRTDDMLRQMLEDRGARATTWCS